MRGHLHYHRLHLLIGHVAQKALQLVRLGRSHAAMDKGAANHIARGTNQTAFVAGLLQNGLDQIAGGRFALGAGDAHHFHLPCRMAVQLGAHGAESKAGIGNQQLGHVQGQKALHHQRRRAILHSLGSVIVRVKARAGNAEEQPPLGFLAAVHAGQQHLAVSPSFRYILRARARQIAQLHCLFLPLIYNLYIISKLFPFDNL